MTFEKYLAKNKVGSWRVEYIQYELLKSFIKSRPSDQQWSSDDEADFIQLFSNEYNKVKLFISSYISQLEGRIQHCRQLLDHSQRHPSHCSDQGFCNSIDDSLIEIIFDINDFSRFIHINHVGFEKTLSKCKKWTNIHGVKGYQHLIGSLDHQRTYLLYAKVSKLRYQCRAIPVATPKVISTPELHPPQTSSKKYWIHPEHLSEVTAILCVHMFIVFDTEMSNFYLDNEAMEGYFDRKNRKDNACTIKCKRYEPDKLYIEQEIHTSVSSETRQLKRRFPVSYNPGHWDNRMNLNFIHDRGSLENQDIKDQIKARSLDHTLQCNYRRLTFQMTNNPRIRITLDTSISYQKPGSAEKHPFGMAVLEVKTTESPGHISGLESLIQNKELVHEIPHFSKYVQGIHQYQVLSEFPLWADQLLNQGKSRSLENKFFAIPRENSILSRSPSLRPLLNGVPYPFSARYPFQRSNSSNNSTITTKNTSEFTSVHIYDSDSSRSPSDFKQVKSDTSLDTFDSMEKGLHTVDDRKKRERRFTGVKVEPKVFFANERTFISWLQFCALLLTVALNLLNFGDKTSRICGAMFLLIAMLLSLYALVRFQYRVRMLRRQLEGRYDDVYGPIVLCILIVGALVINFWLRFK